MTVGCYHLVTTVFLDAGFINNKLQHRFRFNKDKISIFFDLVSVLHFWIY